MRIFLSKFTTVELIIFFAFLIIQIFLRFYNLDFHGIWHDEVGSLYYSTHLNGIFVGESHSVFYYLLLAPITALDEINYVLLRYYHGILSLGLLAIIMIRSWKILSPDQWYFFNTIYGLNPLVFGFARLARSYIFVIDLTVLLIVESRRKERSELLVGFIAMVLTMMHPIAIIPLIIEIVFSSGKRRKQNMKVLGLASLPVVIYYIAKIIIDPVPFSYIHWVNSSIPDFFGSLNNALMGSYFPFSYTTGPFASTIIMGLVLLWAFYSTRKFSLVDGWHNWKVFVFSYVSIILVINLISLVVDLRVNRYYIFMWPYFLLVLSTSFPKESKFLTTGIVGVLASFIVFQVTYLRPYFLKQESYGAFVDNIYEYAQVKGLPVMGCGYSYHNWYFRKLGFKTCEDQNDIEEFNQLKGPFIYGAFDNRLIGLQSMTFKLEVQELQTWYEGTVYLVNPK
jgi:hypothetical protein